MPRRKTRPTPTDQQPSERSAEAQTNRSAERVADFNPSEFDPESRQHVADGTEAGCTEITLDMDEEDAKRLYEAFGAGKLDGLGVVRVTSELGTAGVEDPVPQGSDQKAPAAVSRRSPQYNDQGIRDTLAGARLLEHHNPYLSVIRFDEKPADAVRAKLRDAGFRFEPRNGEWARPIRFDTRHQDRQSAERLFDAICKLIRAGKGRPADELGR